MTLDDLERQNRFFYGFLEISGCETHFKSELRLNQLRYSCRSCIWNFQHWTQISTVLVSIFYVQGNLRKRASNSGTCVQVIILPLLASLLWKRMQIGMGILLITTNTSDELFSPVNIDDYERAW